MALPFGDTQPELAGFFPLPLLGVLSFLAHLRALCHVPPLAILGHR